MLPVALTSSGALGLALGDSHEKNVLLGKNKRLDVSMLEGTFQKAVGNPFTKAIIESGPSFKAIPRWLEKSHPFRSIPLAKTPINHLHPWARRRFPTGVMAIKASRTLYTDGPPLKGFANCPAISQWPGRVT